MKSGNGLGRSCRSHWSRLEIHEAANSTSCFQGAQRGRLQKCFSARWSKAAHLEVSFPPAHAPTSHRSRLTWHALAAMPQYLGLQVVFDDHVFCDLTEHIHNISAARLISESCFFGQSQFPTTEITRHTCWLWNRSIKRCTNACRAIPNCG